MTKWMAEAQEAKAEAAEEKKPASGKAKAPTAEDKIWAAIDAVRNSPHGGSEIADALEAVYGKARP